MMLGSPFFSDFDDNYQYVHPRSFEQQEQQRRAQLLARREEARRHAELEQYYHYRRREQEEEERLRREQQEYERRLRQMKLLQQRRRREQEMQAEEEKYRNELLVRGERAAMEEADRMRALRFLSGNTSRDEDEDDVGLAYYEQEEPVYQLMRGPDGRIYRVQVGVKQVPVVQPMSLSQNIRPLENMDHSMRQAFRGSMDDVVVTENNLEPTNRPTPKVPTPPMRSLSSPSLGAPNEMKTIKSSSRTPPRSKKNSTAKKTRIQVIVEDASDSETEDEFYNSPWRNRRPSPGAWIEPVEYFQDLQR